MTGIMVLKIEPTTRTELKTVDFTLEDEEEINVDFINSPRRTQNRTNPQPEAIASPGKQFGNC
jgi:hypothetical protein